MELPESMIVRETPEDVAALKEERERAQKIVRRFVLTLKDRRELAIWRHRLLAEPESLKSFDVLGKMFGVTGERIRQIEGDLLERLSVFVGNPKSAREIRDNLKTWRRE